MTEQNAFEAALDELLRQLWPRPGQLNRDSDVVARLAALRSVYADWLEERGDATAGLQRWLAREGKSPRDVGTAWQWWSFGNRPDTTPDDLPTEVWEKLPGTVLRRSPQGKEYLTRQDAERALLNALKQTGLNA